MHRSLSSLAASALLLAFVSVAQAAIPIQHWTHASGARVCVSVCPSVCVSVCLCAFVVVCAWFVSVLFRLVVGMSLRLLCVLELLLVLML